MNALPATENFAVLTGPATEWLVLLCPSGRTLALAAALAPYGAWTPTWRVTRQFPRSPAKRKVTEACIPGLVFIPSSMSYEIPPVPRIPVRFMRDHEYAPIRVPDRQLSGLRKIADKPLVKASQLPKPGQRVRFVSGPWQGLIGRIVACTQRVATVAMEKSTQIWQAPPCMLLKI